MCQEIKGSSSQDGSTDSSFLSLGSQSASWRGAISFPQHSTWGKAVNAAWLCSSPIMLTFVEQDGSVCVCVITMKRGGKNISTQIILLLNITQLFLCGFMFFPVKVMSSNWRWRIHVWYSIVGRFQLSVDVQQLWPFKVLLYLSPLLLWDNSESEQS